MSQADRLKQILASLARKPSLCGKPIGFLQSLQQLVAADGRHDTVLCEINIHCFSEAHVFPGHDLGAKLVGSRLHTLTH